MEVVYTGALPLPFGSIPILLVSPLNFFPFPYGPSYVHEIHSRKTSRVGIDQSDQAALALLRTADNCVPLGSQALLA